MTGLVRKEDVLDIIGPRLNSSKPGTLEHQRLYSIYRSVKELPEYEAKDEERDLCDVER